MSGPAAARREFAPGQGQVGDGHDLASERVWESDSDGVAEEERGEEELRAGERRAAKTR